MRSSTIKLVSLADMITLLNASFGFLAILILFFPFSFCSFPPVYLSFSLILLAILADGLDGVVARKTRHGELGEYLEAMADMTSLGIAPSVFVYIVYSNTLATSLLFSILLIAVLLFFVWCSILRLSSFHTLKDKKVFVGLPASASTIIVIVSGFLGIPLVYLLGILVVLSVAMISPVRFPKPGIMINTVACILILVSIVLGKLYLGVAPLLLAVAIALYAIGGPLALMLRPQTKKK